MAAHKAGQAEVGGEIETEAYMVLPRTYMGPGLAHGPRSSIWQEPNSVSGLRAAQNLGTQGWHEGPDLYQCDLLQFEVLGAKMK